jgi:octaprenyl-diphosphate synthase
MKEPNTASASALLSGRRDLADLYAHIQSELDRVEEKLQVFTSSDNRLVAEINGYLFKKRGKRIRPALLILSARLLGYGGEEHIQAASLVEFIHTASLIHDDIIDKADLRRGVDSVHARWGANVSVLLGDFIYIKTIGLALGSAYPRLVRILTDVSTRMIEGELDEFRRSGDLSLSEREYLGIINDKTAVLFAAACRMGGVLAEASPDQEEALAAYGLNLGMAFQIIDDLLDFKGDQDRLGKPVLSDIREGRITLPLIYSINSDGRHNGLRLRALLEDKSLREETQREILDIVRGNGALEYAFRRAQEYSLRAREIIGGFPASTHREALGLLADFVLLREH